MACVQTFCLWLTLGSCDAAQPEAAGSPHPASSATVDSLIARGEAAYLRGQFDSARTRWKDAGDRSRAVHDSVRMARVDTWLGLAAWRQGDYAEAERLGKRALELKLRLQLETDLYKSFNALGLLAWNRGRLEEAIGLFTRARSAATATGDESGVAAVAGNLALVRTELGQFDAAGDGFEEARSAGQRLGDGRVEGNALTNLGMLDIRIGNPAAAVRHLEAARITYRSIGYATGEQNALGQLGTAFAEMGDPGRAIAMLDSALVLSRAQGLKQEEASNLEALAVILRDAGDVRRSLEFYAQARAINGQLGLDVERGVDQREAADIEASLGAFNAAVALVDSALQVHRETGARLEELRDRLLLAQLGELQGDQRAADASLEAAVMLADSMAAPQAWRELALAEADIGSRAGNPSRTLLALRRLGPGWARAPFPVQEAAASLAARAHARLGHLDSAVWYGRRAVYALERVRGSHRSGSLQTGYLADRGAVYGDLASALLARGQVSDAFEVSDAARGRALLDHMVTLQSGESEQHRPTALLAAAEALLGRYAGVTDQLAEAEAEAAAAASSEVSSAVSSLRAAADSLRQEYESAAQAAVDVHQTTAVLGTGRASSSEIQSALRPGEILLEYLATDQELLVFGVTPTAVRFARVPVRAALLASRVRLVRGLLASPKSDPALAYPVLASLHQSLITPAEDAGWLEGAERILVATQGMLTYLPFAALRHPQSGRFLAESYPVVHVPSGAALAALRRRTRQTDGRGPEKGMAFAPLPDALAASGAEVEAVARAAAARSMIGRRATEGALRKALRTGGLVHVATHGYLDPANPMHSRIALHPSGTDPGDDGWLEVHEVLDEKIRSPLIFLSGCETALGAAWSTSFAPGDDFVTLAQAFLYAGADNVVATLWPVQDRAAARFAGAYYGMLRTDPVDALAEAQRTLLRQPEYAHPYFWSGYRITGAGAVTSPSRKPSPNVRLSVQSSSSVPVGVSPPSRHGNR